MRSSCAVGGRRLPSIALIGVLALFFTSGLKAAPISYGDFSVPPSGIMFLDVEESSGTDAVPLYGPPDPFLVGLDFDPAGFIAYATGGGADFTDGQLNFTVMSSTDPGEGVGIESIDLFEAGDYTLDGAGTAATRVSSGASIRASVTQIDGIPVIPIQLTPVNSSIGFNLVANPGVLQPWSLGLVLNVESQLAIAGIPFTIGATKVEVVIDNQLLAMGESGSVAAIAKKEFVLDIIPDQVEKIPEPTSAVLMSLAIGLVGLCSSRRR